MLSPTKLVFMHLPRTGGTTLHRQLTAAFAPAQICPERTPALVAWPAAKMAPYLLFSGHFNSGVIARIPGEKHLLTVLREPRARVVSTWQFWARHQEVWHGEGNLPGLAAARRSPGMAAFLAVRLPEVCDAVNNQMARYLAGQVTAWVDGQFWENRRRVSDAEVLERAEATLRRCAVVGVTEALDDFYARVSARFGLPPQPVLPRLNGRDAQRPEWDPAPEPAMTPEAEALLDELTRLDQPIYALARRLAGQA
jgi:hypothetical protein